MPKVPTTPDPGVPDQLIDASNQLMAAALELAGDAYDICHRLSDLDSAIRLLRPMGVGVKDDDQISETWHDACRVLDLYDVLLAASGYIGQVTGCHGQDDPESPHKLKERLTLYSSGSTSSSSRSAAATASAAGRS